MREENCMAFRDQISHRESNLEKCAPLLEVKNKPAISEALGDAPSHL